ncbi:hypothetical protein EV421DRAFT_1911028 [Armillaria borealis]|uniref:Secreted protein n=1 Tax=Armillaria borealis TaxID=47425 RepID=A0AA39IZ05_9AGAR|nr:hypothetical protein EV421DRAFT_1911028 [Armillaria borealis]
MIALALLGILLFVTASVAWRRRCHEIPAVDVLFQVDEALTTGIHPLQCLLGDLFSFSFNQGPFLSLGVCYFSLCGSFNHLSSLGVCYGYRCTSPPNSYYNKRLITIKT